MNRQAWDERYAARDLVWSAEPNVFVAEETQDLAPGRALDLACGEGRNAIWLARRGWKVTGVDFSDVALAKARRLASHAEASVDWRCEDLVAWVPPEGSFDLVVLSYLHLPAEGMAGVVARACTALAPGGTLVVVGHARANLGTGVGGPQEPAVLYEPDDVVAWVGNLEVTRAEHVERTVDSPEGPRQAVDTLVVAHLG